MTIDSWVAYIIGGAFLLLCGTLAIVLVVNADQRVTLAASDAARVMLVSQNREWAQKTARTDAVLAGIKAAETASARAVAKAEIAAAGDEKNLKDEAAALAALPLTGSDCRQAMALRKFYLDKFR